MNDPFPDRYALENLGTSMFYGSIVLTFIAWLLHRVDRIAKHHAESAVEFHEYMEHDYWEEQ